MAVQRLQWQQGVSSFVLGHIPPRLPSERAVEKLAESGGIGYPEAGLGGSDAYLDGQQARSTEFKHALVGKVIAGTEGYFVIIVLLEHPGNGGPFVIFRCRHFHHPISATHFN